MLFYFASPFSKEEVGFCSCVVCFMLLTLESAVVSDECLTSINKTLELKLLLLHVIWIRVKNRTFSGVSVCLYSISLNRKGVKKECQNDWCYECIILGLQAYLRLRSLTDRLV